MLMLRSFLFALGLVGLILGVAMLIPACADILAGREEWQIFAASGLLSAFFGGATAIIARSRPLGRTDLRQTLLVIVATWAVLPAVAGLPLWLGPYALSAAASYFEAVSAVTTTGATTMVGLDALNPGVLLWRSILQWLGGVGIVVTAVAILPELRIGGLELFRLEFAQNTEKVLPRARQLSIAIMSIYLGLTLLCAVSYGFAGMEAFDAINHAMTTVATGGMSTKDASFSAFEAPGIHYVACVFMIAGGLPFLALLAVLRGGWLGLIKDPQVPAFIALVCVASLVVAVIAAGAEAASVEEALRLGSLNAISIITGTGYTSGAYDAWSGFSQALFLSFMFWGACAGSTTCSVKLFRYQIMISEIVAAARRALFPHSMITARYGGKPITAQVSASVFAFFAAFVGLFWLFSAGMGFLGYDPLTSISAAASALCNVGPGLGDIVGPTGNYEPLSDAAKLWLALAMIMGRLEILPVLALMRPAFWRF